VARVTVASAGATLVDGAEAEVVSGAAVVLGATVVLELADGLLLLPQAASANAATAAVASARTWK
jgi:hypothetical protein